MIRQAVRSDAGKAVPLIVQAIGHLAFVLTGTNDIQEAASVLNDFFGQEDNRISYQNALSGGAQELLHRTRQYAGSE
jgi:hypothetical protein